MKKLNILVIGAIGVGKSKLIERIITGEWSARPSISDEGIDFKSKKESAIDYGFWICPGKEGMDQMIPLYRDKAHIIFLCFNPKDKESFDTLKTKIEKIHPIPEHCQLMLVQTKSDDMDLPVAVSKDDIQKLKETLQENRPDINIEEFKTTAELGIGTETLMERVRAIAQSLPEITRGSEPTRETKSGSSFCLNALLATAAVGGLALCVAALVTALVVSSLPLSIALFAAGTASGLAATGMFFYRRCSQDNNVPQSPGLVSA